MANVPGSLGDSLEMQVSTASSGSAGSCRPKPSGGDEVNIERSYMYAVVKTGGKQYKVAAGEKIKVEQIAADVGQEIVLDQVLAVGNGAELTVGAPLVAGASVKATVVAQGQSRQGSHLQDAPSQALPKARRSSPALH